MNSAQAKQILMRHPPSVTADPADRELTEALGLLKREPDLLQWWETQRKFDNDARAAFRDIPVPAGLARRIVAGQKVIPLKSWWQKPWALGIAAALALMLTGWFFWSDSAAQGEFSAFQIRMARSAVRDYRMDMQSADLTEIRQFLAARQFPADYTLNPKLQKLPGLGCGAIRWQDHAVSMVCFDRGQNQLLWLFVADAAAIHGAPSTAKPTFEALGKLTTASWVEDGKLYLLALQGERSELEAYF